MTTASKTAKPLSKVFKDFLEKAYGPYFSNLPDIDRTISASPQKIPAGNHSCAPCMGPFEYWGKSSGHQMLRCKSCQVVHFFETGEMQGFEVSYPRETDAESSAQENPRWKLADMDMDSTV